MPSLITLEEKCTPPEEDFEWARNDFNQAISLNPNYGKAYKNRGLVYTETGEPEKGLNDFSKAIFFKYGSCRNLRTARQVI